MNSQVLITPIDEIVTYIKKNPRTSISKISKIFKIREDLVDRWISVLEEQEILVVDFKGLDSVVSFKEHNGELKKINVENVKELFVQACYKKKVATPQMKELWIRFYKLFESEIKSEFEKECVKKGFDKKKIPMAWKKFSKTLEVL